MKAVKDMINGLDRKDSLLEMHINELTNVIMLLISYQSELSTSIDEQKEERHNLFLAINAMFYLRSDLTKLLAEAKSQMTNN